MDLFTFSEIYKLVYTKAIKEDCVAFLGLSRSLQHNKYNCESMDGLLTCHYQDINAPWHFMLQVHVGFGIMVKSAKLQYIMRSQNETKVAREMASYFWTPAYMQGRSLTGQPCRRQADSVAKLQATPHKADAIMSMLYMHSFQK